MYPLLAVFGFLGLLSTLFYYGGSAKKIALISVLYCLLAAFWLGLPLGFVLGISALCAGLASVFTFPFIRQPILTRVIFSIYRRVMPKLSDTERAALSAGTVAWEGQLLSGAPDLNALSNLPYSTLTADEQAFLTGPLLSACALMDREQIAKDKLIPEHLWQFLKSAGFFGMIIPKAHGGLGFSAYAQARVLAKLASVSPGVATVVCVPNSLGPAELLLHYGTEAQKAYYLPRLASGEEMPCFALTSPTAGSDAASLIDHGVVCQAEYAGEMQLCLRLNWNKRYITLSPVATLIGLAFKCYDPDHLLGDRVDLGMTCALISTQTPGVTVGRRHNPLYSDFPNGPTQGKDVLVPIDSVIGGRACIGSGWQMLMACLAAGRGISLPSITMGSATHALLTTSAYAGIRTQFNVPIARFEAVAERLARMTARTYIIGAMHRLTLAYLDAGEHPAVITAIAKHHVTEMSRQVVIDAMDVQGGKAICMGPRNYVAKFFIESPISITVEGANILTRALIIFGQGAVRSHPYLLKEIEAALNPDAAAGLQAFDRSFWQHIRNIFAQQSRAFALAWRARSTRFLTTTSDCEALLQRFSAALSLVADAVMFRLGAKLKQKESMSGRLGDVLSLLYMLSAVIKQDQTAGIPEESAVKAWAVQWLVFEIQNAFLAIFDNLPGWALGRYLRAIVFPLGASFKAPQDSLTQQVAAQVIKPGVFRDRIAQWLGESDPSADPQGVELEAVLAMVGTLGPLAREVKSRYAEEKRPMHSPVDWIDWAQADGVLDAEQAAALHEFEQRKMEIIQVDDFSADEMR